MLPRKILKFATSQMRFPAFWGTFSVLFVGEKMRSKSVSKLTIKFLFFPSFFLNRMLILSNTHVFITISYWVQQIGRTYNATSFDFHAY